MDTIHKPKNPLTPLRSVALIGLGAIGILFGRMLALHADGSPDGYSFRVVADPERIARYRREGVFFNGEPCDFDCVTPDEDTGPADLVMFAVKDTGLDDAIAEVRRQVGPSTLFLSLLNGISSEDRIAAVYGAEGVLPCTVQGMDAVREGTRLVCQNTGWLAFGERPEGDQSEPVHRIAALFDRAELPYRVMPDMRRHLWGKFMLNVGINQVLAIHLGDYGLVQHPGEARDLMIAAMREAAALSVPEGIGLGETDISRWLEIVATLAPGGKPSMVQDIEAGRPTEVELFAGTVLRMGHRHGIDTPVNRALYDRIRAMESARE